jgi:hypothetical protein
LKDKDGYSLRKWSRDTRTNQLRSLWFVPLQHLLAVRRPHPQLNGESNKINSSTCRLNPCCRDSLSLKNTPHLVFRSGKRVSLCAANNATGEDTMPTDLDALAARNREARVTAENEKSVMLASFTVCLIVLRLMFAFPALARAMALLGRY